MNDINLANGDQDTREFERRTLPQVLRALQQTPLPVPMQNPTLLPVSLLDPEVMERLAAELVSLRNNLGAHFYGRRGQKQYGLDIVELEPDAACSLYQVKRYETLSADQMVDIVDDYAGPPRPPDYQGPERRFNPHRVVIITSAPVESDTGNVDGLKELQDRYQGDLTIEVWGAEALGRKLRELPHLVLAIFGPAWAKAWCGFAPAPPAPGAPPPLGLVEDPVAVLHFDAMEAEAASRQEANPLAAAALFGRIAEGLREGGFPGHAAAMRGREAAAAEAGGDPSAAFTILFRLSLDTVLAGERLGSPRQKVAELAAGLDQAQQDKSLVIGAVADWYEHGSQLTDVVPALTRLTEIRDPDAAILVCLVIEQAVADGLFDQVPPDSITAQVDEATPRLLHDLKMLAATTDTRDVVVRARLRCAAADAELTLNADTEAVDQAYSKLVQDALAGRYQHARGLVASRAAYAYAARGEADRAITLWRQSILACSEDGYYGDARNAIRATRRLCWDDGIINLGGLETAASALPNLRRLLAGTYDPALTTLDAAHRGRLPDAFGDARRYLLESRLSGHLYEEILAQTLLGDVVAAAGQPMPAARLYVMAGQADNAAKLAADLPAILDMNSMCLTGLRRRRAAAIKVIGAQAALFNDEDVPGVIECLLSAAGGAWTAPFVQPHPERDALTAIASFGIRIPETAVDQILAVAEPALTQTTVISDTIANLLIQTYWAVPSRRDDLAQALTRMLRLADPPYNLWGFVVSLPSAARAPMLPAVRDLAEQGNAEAITALASWRDALPVVQVAARRACAAFLRRSVGIKRTVTSVGNEETTVVHLLIALLDADQLSEVPISELTPEKARPAGGVLFTSVFGASGGDGAQPVEPTAEFPDSAAIHAVGPPSDLAVAVARHLTAIGGDTCSGAAPRANALSALRLLLPRLAAPVLAELFPQLLNISREPGLSEADQFELSMDTGLSRGRIRTGAKILAGLALLAAAESFAERRDATQQPDATDHAAANDVIAQAVGLMRDTEEGSENRLLGALSIAAIARSAPDFAIYATGLLFSGDEQARALGARYTPGSPELFRIMADDPSSLVRVSVASRAPELPKDVRANLISDAHAHVRHASRAE